MVTHTNSKAASSSSPAPSVIVQRRLPWTHSVRCHADAASRPIVATGVSTRSNRISQSSGPPMLPISLEKMTTSITQPTTRSEEHTSELQSLMRISYAVFCLKKKKDDLQIHM